MGKQNKGGGKIPPADLKKVKELADKNVLNMQHMGQIVPADVTMKNGQFVMGRIICPTVPKGKIRLHHSNLPSFSVDPETVSIETLSKLFKENPNRQPILAFQIKEHQDSGEYTAIDVRLVASSSGIPDIISGLKNKVEEYSVITLSEFSEAAIQLSMGGGVSEEDLLTKIQEEYGFEIKGFIPATPGLPECFLVEEVKQKTAPATAAVARPAGTRPVIGRKR